MDKTAQGFVDAISDAKDDEIIILAHGLLTELSMRIKNRREKKEPYKMCYLLYENGTVITVYDSMEKIESSLVGANHEKYTWNSFEIQ